jgi:molybdopterin-guanine dinucleotide biosynthesis protein A
MPARQSGHAIFIVFLAFMGASCSMLFQDLFKYYNTVMLSVVIQAGGQSTRMGEDKALKPFLGRPLIQRVIDRLQPIAVEMIVTTNRPENYSFLDTSTGSVHRLRLVPDLIPERGALGGLYTALASATGDLVAVVACDMPFASPMLLETAVRLMVEEGTDVVIPESPEGLEPLHAVYRRVTCVPAIEAAIKADQWKVISWFPQVKVRVLKPEESQAIDPTGLCFWNLNTPEEFAEAEERAKRSDYPTA